MAWAFVGVSASVESTTTAITLAEPAGVADGDLLVACFASRSTATTAISNTGWTAVASQNTNNTGTTAAAAIASGTMLYQVRAGAPDLSFVIPAGISVCLGRVVAYRGGATTTPLDVTTAVTTSTSTTAVSVAGLTTTAADDLIVALAAGGQEAAWSAFNATSPSGASGATSTATPTTAWLERADVATTTGNDTSLAIFDAIKATAGATGNLTATASLGAGHVVIAGAFKIAPAVSTPDAWNVNDKSPNIALSNSDKTATSTSTAIGGARSTQTWINGTAGKYYAECYLPGLRPNLGITATANSLTNILPTFCVLPSTGDILINNVTVGNIGVVVAGDIVSIAWNAGAEQVWFRKNAGNWNNNASANPGAGAGGLDCSFTTDTPHALWMRSTTSLNTTIVLRTEAAEFTQSTPAGFTSWMGEALAPAEINVTTGTQATLATTQSAAADVDLQVSAAQTTLETTQTGTITAQAALAVTGAQTTSATTQVGTVGVRLTVTGAQSTLAATQSALADVDVRVTATQTLSAATSAAAASVGLSVSGAQTLQAATLSATAGVLLKVTGEQNLRAPTQSLLADVDVRATAAQTLTAASSTGSIGTAALTKTWIKHAGQWKQATVSVRHAGVWKAATPWVKQAGTWKRA